VSNKPMPSLDAAKARLREAGLRCTAARLAVLAHLMEATGPKTHAEVSDSLTDRGFDRATIYRNLTELTEATIVSRVELGDHVWRFELRRGGDHGQEHPHFLCTACGEVSCLDDVNVAITPKPGVAAAAKPKSKAQRGRPNSGQVTIGTVTEVLLKGRCDNCG
jgi:Fur family transcriptional regulator, ferric uptake regulator